MEGIFQFLKKFEKYTKNTDLFIAFGILAILCVMVVPLPPIMLDLALTFSLALSILILLVSIYIKKSLEFSVFPWSATFFFSSYVNDMPLDLPQKARRDDVHKILGPPSEVTKVPLSFTERYKSESYELEDFIVTCWYSIPSYKLDSMIVLRQDFLQSLSDESLRADGGDGSK